MIDLRSDTVTKPTEKMRRAMAEAEVGDDVYREDPTVNRLEHAAAAITGKEAALFVPTGTMGNTIGIKLHTRHGQEVICDARAHVLDYELAMMAWFAGCVARPIQTGDGILRWQQIQPRIKPRGPHCAPTGVITVENTHNMAGGRVYPTAVLAEICQEAHARGLKVHMDGARVFNAAEALGKTVREVVAPVDTVTFCLSKALGAPVGSMLAGSAEQMDEARLLRKRLGGGMRQAGVLAAAGLIALEDSPARLAADHANARFLAQRLTQIDGVEIDPATVETNIVIFDVSQSGIAPSEISRELKARGVLLNPISESKMRAVTHYDVTREDCARAVDALSQIIAGISASPDRVARVSQV